MYNFVAPYFTEILGFPAPALIQYFVGLIPLLLCNMVASLCGRSKTTAYRVFLVTYNIILALIVISSNGNFPGFLGVTI